MFKQPSVPPVTHLGVSPVRPFWLGILLILYSWLLNTETKCLHCIDSQWAPGNEWVGRSLKDVQTQTLVTRSALTLLTFKCHHMYKLWCLNSCLIFKALEREVLQSLLIRWPVLCLPKPILPDLGNYGLLFIIVLELVTVWLLKAHLENRINEPILSSGIYLSLSFLVPQLTTGK